VAAVLLSPVAPNKGLELAQKLGVKSLDVTDVQLLSGLVADTPVAPGEPLFPRMLALPERIQAVLDEVVPSTVKTVAKVSHKKKPKQEAKVAEETTTIEEFIQFEDFMKVKLKVGEIVSAEKHPNADRLLALMVEVGEDRPRSIVAGIAAKYVAEDLIGKKIVIVANLKPRKLRGVLSEGMLLAASGTELEGLITVDPGVNPGSSVG
jgi:methionyl-tRNA synthetase